ncbi:amino acid adenylation domain-containing protein, partial [Rhodococcus sp. NPDC057014]|uniref:amino acid adenylation domain-containing protein n=1 Tax=Rhodococcus sp. NPDC057014 TaxID=3346000 RepID=UPI0036269640
MPLHHRARDVDAFPLSSAQRGMWLAQRLAPDVALCIAQYVELHGPLDLDLLNEASLAAGREFQSTFLRIVEMDGEPFQVIDPTIELSTDFVDFRTAADPVGTAHAWMEGDYTSPIDVTRDMLAKSAVLQVGEQDYLWYSRIHHVALDGYGAMTLVNRIATLYSAATEGRSPEPNRAADLRTLCAIDREYRASRRFESDHAYWADRVAEMTAGASLSPVAAAAVARCTLANSALSDEAARRLARSHHAFGATAAAVVVSAFGCYLARMTGNDEVLVNLPVSARTTVILRRSGGMLVTVAPLQVSTRPDDTLANLIQRVQWDVTGALRHQRYTLEDIRREAGRKAARVLAAPMVNVMLFRPKIILGALAGEFHVVTSGPVDDLLVNVYTTGTPEKTMVEFRGNPGRYTDEDLRSHQRAFVGLLEEFLTADPAAAPADLHAETAAEGARRRGRAVHLEFWRSVLDGLSTEPVLRADHVRPGHFGDLDGRVVRHVPADVHGKIRDLGKAGSFASYSVVHTALAALLARLSGRGDVAVGVPAGPHGWPLILRSRVDAASTFAELLVSVHTIEVAAFRHAEIPFDDLATALGLPTAPGASYPCQVGFVFARAGPADAEARMPAGGGTDLQVTCTEHGTESGIDVEIVYSTALFDPATIETFTDQLVRMLEAATAEPDVAVGDLVFAAPTALAGLTPAVGAPTRPVQLFPDLLTAAMAAERDAVAVADGTAELTYRELDRHSNRLARLLVERGAGPETVVALALPRSVEFVVAVWATAKSGAAFLPVDPTYPAARIDHMLTDSGAQIGITTSSYRAALAQASSASWIELDDAATTADVERCRADALVEADRRRPLRPDHPAYVIYTSGSTGIPKGVVVTHRGLANLVAAERESLIVHPASRVAQFASPSFDASLFELLAAVGSGARLEIVPRGVFGGVELTRVLTERRITHAVLTPSTLATLDPGNLPTLTHLVVAGEACPPDAVVRWSAGRRMFNAYGPTEATIMSTLSGPMASTAPVTIGGPVRGMSVVVLDERLHPVPPGVAGELYLSGPALARGYHRRTGVTAARFVADPFGRPGDRMYRTGDVVRWTRENHVLDYIGRSDSQVKVRGFRIELGEVDAVLTDHPAVGFAATVDYDTGSGETTLVSYVRAATGEGLDLADVDRHVRQTLPHYMVPLLVPIDTIPLTPGGKLDRTALPPPPVRAGDGRRTPTTPTEEVIAKVFESVLGVDGIGVDDDYFDLGGNSLTATRVVARANAALGARIDVAELFDAPTVATFAARIDGAGPRGADRPALHRFPRPARIPLSPAQQRMWFINQYDTTSPAYNIPLVVRLAGVLDVPALVAAVTDVVERHESLRTVFPASVDGPHQVVVTAAEAVPEIRPVPVRDETDLDRHLAETCASRFDVSQAAPLRVTLFELSDTEHVLALVLHHVAADGASTAPLARDVTTAYTARTAGRPPQWEPLDVQYVDYTLWQYELLGTDSDPGSTVSRQLDYWSENLSGLPELLELPTDRPRPAAQSLRGGRAEFGIDAALHDSIRALARRHTSTVFMTMHAALAVLLARLTGSDDIAVGTPVAGRGEAALDDVVGMFVNTLVLRTRIDRAASFTDTVQQTRGVDLAAFGHADIPFEQLVEELEPQRSAAHPPLFQVLLEFQNVLPSGEGLHGLELPGLRIDSVPYDAGISKFDLQLWLTENLADDGTPLGMQAGFVYAADLFDPDTIHTFADRFVRILEAVTTDPDVPVGDIDLLDAGEQEAALAGWRGPPAPATGTLVDEFTRSAARYAHAAALTAAGETLGYAELAARVNRWARYLQRRGVTSETVVAVALPPSIESVVATLAVLVAGGVCLPLQVDWPAARIAHALTQAGPTLVLTRRADADAPLGLGATPVLVDAPDVVADIAGISAAPVTETERAQALRPDSAAYVVFTAGSTARPKPVTMTHRGLISAFEKTPRAWRFDRTDTWAMVPSHAVDLTLWELWGAILHGARLVIVDTGTARSPQELCTLLRHERVTVLSQNPTAFEQTAHASMSADGDLPAMRLVVLAGEPPTKDLLSLLPSWVETTSAVVDLYTTTETLTCLASATATTAREVSDLALRPCPDRRTVVLDRRLRLVPNGVIGELYAGGAELARGYHHRPALTATHFVACPFGDPGHRMYRTGDLARVTRDGRLEILGRCDFQPRLRGCRVVPDEVDTVLRRHRTVAGSVTVDHTRTPGEPILVSYVAATPGTSVDPAAVRTYAATTLPSHLVPTAIVVVDAFPLDATGAIDRAALPVPEFLVDAAEFRAPRTAHEEAVAGVFARVLGVEGVGVDDNFFELGGTSLVATKVVARLNSALGTGIGVRTLFEAPTVEALAAVLEKAEDLPAGRPALGPRRHSGPAPVSFAQQRMWFVNQFDTTAATYNIPMIVRIEGPLDVDALRAALRDVAGRHEALRTVYPLTENGPVQVVSPLEDMPFELSPVPVVDESDLDHHLRHVVGTGFDVTTELPLRAFLWQVDPHVHVLAVVVHHISADGSSLAPLARDLTVAYTARNRGGAPEWPPLPLQYSDYTVWQRDMLGSTDDPDSPISTQLRYWRTTLADLPDRLELPLDHPRPATASTRAATVRFEIPPATHRRIDRFSLEHGVTPFVTVHAALAVLLSRLADSGDISIGSPIAGRGEEALDELVGMFVGTLVLRTRIESAASFAEVLACVRDTDIDAFAHADIPFERLVEEIDPARSTAVHPLFQVMLSFQNMEQPRPELPGLDVSVVDLDAHLSPFDLNVVLREHVDGAGSAAGISAQIIYAIDLFDEHTVQRFADRFLRVIDAALADPAVVVGDLALLDDAERDLVLERWNATAHESPEETVVDLFDAQVARTPDADAVTFAERSMTYRDFDRWVNRLARELISRDIGPENVVALAAPRSFELLAGLYAVTKTGAAFLMLDLANPPERISYLLRTSAPALVLIGGDTDLALPHGLPGLRLEGLDVSGRDCAPITDHDRVAPLRAANTAYIVFTSGSTGHPKGVTVSHAAIASQLRWSRSQLPLGPGDRTVQKAPIAFDVAVWECLAPLCSGAALILLRPDGHLDFDYLAATMAAEEITVVEFVPSILAVFVDDSRYPLPASLRRVLSGGETISHRTAAKVLELGVGLGNMYGPAEAAITVTYCDVDSSDGDPIVPIGPPVWNTCAYVLDGRLHPAPPGAVGDLYIAGKQLARGYLGRMPLTAARFVADPHGAPGTRMYRTGDRARWTDRGQLEYRGRSDFQVQLHGYRIEPGEIENTLLRQAGVAQAVVVLQQDVHGTAHLIGYVVAATGTELDGADLITHLAAALPAHMVPTAVIPLAAFPWTAHGKVDRGALPLFDFAARSSSRMPATDVERVLVSAFSEVLGLDEVGIEDSFFALGGDSIMAIQLVARAREAGVVLTPREVFEHRTIGRLARAIESADVQSPVLEELPGFGVGEMPLTPIAHWLLDRGTDIGRFSQAALFTAPPGLDPDRLARTVQTVLDRHDLLRARLHRAESRRDAAVEVLPAGSVDAAGLLRRVPVDELAGALFQSIIDCELRSATARLDPDTGIMVQVVWFESTEDRPDPGRLLFVIHHLAVDGVSWRILVPDLAAAWAAVSTGTPPALPPVGTSMRRWAHALTDTAPDRATELPLWR